MSDNLLADVFAAYGGDRSGSAVRGAADDGLRNTDAAGSVEAA